MARFIPYQAIRSRFIGPTNHRPSRLIVTAEAGRKVIPWNHGEGIEENHARAAEAFARAWGWSGVWYGGAHGDSFWFVRVSAHDGNPDGAAFVIPACKRCGHTLETAGDCPNCKGRE